MSLIIAICISYINKSGSEKEKYQCHHGKHLKEIPQIEGFIGGQRPSRQLAESMYIKLYHTLASLDFTLCYSIKQQFEIHLGLSTTLLTRSNHSITLK